MADFLSRLAERTLGTAAVIQPVPVPLFAPAPTGDFLHNPEDGSNRPGLEDYRISSSLETVFPQPLVTREGPLSNVARPLARSPAHGQHGSQIGEIPDPLSDGEATIGRPLTGGDTPLEPRPRANDRLSWQLREALTHPHAATGNESALSLPSFVPHASQVPSRRSSLETSQGGASTVIGNFVSPHEHKRLGPSAPGQGAQEPAHRTVVSPPVIRVTIGRIEVRAIAPPGPAVSRAPSTRPAPRLSLQEYLGQHERRKR
jgi:hypothetical protein